MANVVALFSEIRTKLEQDQTVITLSKENGTLLCCGLIVNSLV